MSTVTLASCVGLVLALGGTSALGLLKYARKRDAPGNNGTASAKPAIRPWRHLMFTWGSSILLLLLIWFWEQRSVASIGIHWGNWQAWAMGVLVGFGVLMAGGVFLQLSRKKMPGATSADSAAGIARIAATPLWFRVAAVLTAGITEEIVFRGYPIERLLEMSGNLWMAALIPLLVFTLAHLSGWGPGHLISVLIGGLILTALYLWQRDLIACMIAHTLIDLPLLFAPLFVKKMQQHTQAMASAAPLTSP